MDPTVVTIVGNVIAIIAGLWFFADRFRRWVETKVAEPVRRIENKVDSQDSTIQDLTKRVDSAHERIDQFMLGGHNA